MSIGDTDDSVYQAVAFLSAMCPAKANLVRRMMQLEDRELDNSLRRLKKAGKVKFMRGVNAGWVVCQ